MSWEQQYLELRINNQLAVHDTQIQPDNFVKGLGEIYAGLLSAVSEEQPGSRVKLADFAVEYLNIARSVYQAGPSYTTIKDQVLSDLGKIK